MKRTQKGFAHLALLLLLVVVVAAAYVGYKVVKSHQQAATSSQTSTGVTKPVSATIKSTTDLDKASATLNSQDIDSQLNPDSLNNDVQSLL